MKYRIDETEVHGLASDLAKKVHVLLMHEEPFHRCPENRCQRARGVLFRGEPYPGPTAEDLRDTGELPKGA